MLCDECNQREALINFTQMMGDEKIVKNLCLECAQKQGFENPILDLSKILGKLLVGLLDQHINSKKWPKSTRNVDEKVCTTCRLTWSEFEENGLLGCPKCYEQFQEQLKVLLRRVHGNNHHVGQKLPGNQEQSSSSSQSLDVLKKKLQHAIQTENYEKAAEIRDQIQKIEVN